jgi:glycosyltransferase involved in cell wall biosynthesis
MGDPLVSVITPVLNRVETMGACIASIKADVSTDRAHRC